MLGALAACSKPSVGPADVPGVAATTSTPPSTADASTAAALADLAANKAAATIDADGLRRDITELSDDRYEGRGPGTRGDELARKWLAQQLQGIGLQPGAADGGWQQPFDLVGIKSHMPATWTFSKGGRQVAYKWWDDYIGSSGVQSKTASIRDAEVVFVGYGIEAPEFDWDDYKGTDLKGKVLLMLNNDPDWDPALFAGHDAALLRALGLQVRRGGAPGCRRRDHRAHDALRGLSVAGAADVGLRRAVRVACGRRASPPVQDLGDGARRARPRRAGRSGSRLRWLQAAKRRDFKPVPLGVTTSLESRNELQRTRSANVLGLLRGSDPQLASEVVVITAHHDHLGVGEPDASGDRIYNGAVDNAAGVAEVLAIARACKALPTAPKRSILFNLVGGEEQDLLGSQTTPRTRRSRRGASPRTSTTTAATSGAARAT